MEKNRDVECCSNCDAPIGRLETPYLWKEHVVCKACHGRLGGTAPAGTAAAEAPLEIDAFDEAVSRDLNAAAAKLDYATPAPKRVLPTTSKPGLRAGEIICPNPNCGYVGKPERKARGSTAVLLVLLLLGVLPAIIYGIAYDGYENVCPRCKMKLGRA